MMGAQRVRRDAQVAAKIAVLVAVATVGSLEAGELGKEFCYLEAPFPRCHASSLIELPGGDLLVTYFGGTREKSNDVAIWASRGTKKAGSAKPSWDWAAPVEVHREPNIPCWNPVLVAKQHGEGAGTILLFFKAGPSPSEWSGFVRRSTDDGKTWSEAEILPSGVMGPVRSKPVELDDGTLICGSSTESYKAWTCYVDITPDAGKTWTKSGPIVVPGHPYGIIQPSVFFTSEEGRLGLLCRSRGLGKICRSYSTDNGRTWSNAEPTDLPNPNAGCDAVHLADGRIVLIYNPTTRGRSPLALAVSEDDGMTFERSITLEDEPGHEFSYPAIIQGDDGMLHMCYTWKRQRIRHAFLDPADL